MANRRMLAVKIIESDEFCSMSISAQALYIHLIMNADDDGAVDNWQSIIRYLPIRRDSLKRLLDMELVDFLPSGALLITDWLYHNKIRGDRYTPGRHRAELEAFQISDNKRYYR